MDWTDVNTKGVIGIDRVAEVFEIWTDERLPFAKFKIKVLERKNGGFLGVPNVAVRNPVTGEPEWISGLGLTISEALADTLKSFFSEIDGHASQAMFDDCAFAWSDPEEF
jgi:hypothetical protein